MLFPNAPLEHSRGIAKGDLAEGLQEENLLKLSRDLLEFSLPEPLQLAFSEGWN
jgi:hypothetical protein